MVATTGFSSRVLLWDTLAGQQVGTIEGSRGLISGISFSEDGKRLEIIGDRPSSWDLMTMTEVDYAEKTPPSRFRPGSTDARNGGSYYCKSFDGTLEIRSFGKPLAEHPEYGKSLVVTETSTGKIISTAKTQKGLSISRNNKMFATGIGAGAQLYDTQSGKVLRKMNLPQDEFIYSTVFSADSRRLIGAGNSGTIYFWDVATGDLVCSFEEHADYIMTLAISDDGTRIASASGDMTTKILDSKLPLEREKERATMRKRRADVRQSIQQWRSNGLSLDAIAENVRHDTTLTTADRIYAYDVAKKADLPKEEERQSTQVAVTPFVDGGIISVGAAPRDLALLDFNGDGHLDITNANAASNTISMATGFGDGTFSAANQFDVGFEPISLAASDINGDGKIDIVVSNYVSRDLSILIGKDHGDRLLAEESRVALKGKSFQPLLSDLNGDGFTDLAMTTSHTLSIQLGRSDGTLSEPHEYGETSMFRLAAADFDGDGDLDISALTYTGAERHKIMLNDGTGKFVDGETARRPTRSNWMKAGDLDGDGDPDLVISNPFLNTLSILFNRGDATFDADMQLAAGNNPFGIALADFNDDGYLDIVCANSMDNNLSLMLNRGDGTFEEQICFAQLNHPSLVEAADLDDDGDIDLVVSNMGSNTLSVQLNQQKESAD